MGDTFLRTGNFGRTATNTFDANDWTDNDTVTNNPNPYFDANGNMLTNGAIHYGYDWANRLTGYTNGTSIETLVYDAAGNRFRRTTGTETNLYLVSMVNPTGYPQLVEEFAVNGTTTNLVRVYTHGLALISQRAPNVVTNFFGFDGHGSTRFLSNSGGNLTDTYLYDAFGNLISQSGSRTNFFLYCGELYDTNMNLYYLRARYYDPTSARFLTLDTYEGNPEDPLSLHKYSYCAENPVNRVDPSGRAAYFVERKLGIEKGEESWAAGYGHGYLLFTAASDPGNMDPFISGQPVVDTFSWHPYEWNYDTSARPGVPGRVWELHPGDVHPGKLNRSFLITTDQGQQAILLNQINSWIRGSKCGFEGGTPKPDPAHLGNEIGEPHVKSPDFGVYYSLAEQNCVWWATAMLKQSSIKVPRDVYEAITEFNQGYGAASQIISGERSANDVRTLRGIPYGQFRMPAILQIDSSAFGF